MGKSRKTAKFSKKFRKKPRVKIFVRNRHSRHPARLGLLENFLFSSSHRLPKPLKLLQTVTFNPAAAPFRPPSRIVNDYPTIKIGPSNLAVNEKIWKAVANNRVLPALPQPPARPVLSPHSIYVSPINLRSVSPLLHSPSYNSTFVSTAWKFFEKTPKKSNFFPSQTVPPQFPEDYSRNMVFTRDFGPVAHRDGFVDLRLRDDIK